MSFESRSSFIGSCSGRGIFSGRARARISSNWLVFLLIIAPNVLLDAQERSIGKVFPPEVAEASDEGATAMQAMQYPEGWRIELFASEPQVANVVSIDVDHQGRIYVGETYRQNKGVTDNRGHDDKWLLADLAAETVQDRIDYHRELLGDAVVTYEQQDDRIRRIEDTNGDGTADVSVVVANGFNHLEEGTGAGVLWRPSGLYYACIPKLWRLIDQDNDGVVDERVVLADGFGVRVAFRGHDLHGLMIGPDGRLYFSIGDRGYHVRTNEGVLLANPDSGAVFRCELDGSNLEVFCSGLRNPQELAFNDMGDFFTVDNNSDSGDQARVVHLLEDGDSGWRMYYQYLPDRGPFNRELLWKPFHSQQPAYIVPPIANFTDGPSGFAYYPGTGLGDKYRDTFFICDFRGGAANSGVRSFRVEPHGASYRFGVNDNPIWNVLATDITFGPDGSLFISDWVNGWDGLGKGRIYRFYDPEFYESDAVKDVKKRLAVDWAAVDESFLVEGLAHRDRRVRLESQWELANRESWELLSEIAEDTSLARVNRLHGIWGADQVARSKPSLATKVADKIRPLMNDSDSFIRSAAVKFAGERGDQLALATIRELVGDDSARVRYFVLRALADLRDSLALQPIVRLIESESSKDPAIRHAAIVALSKTQTAQQLKDLRIHSAEDVRRAAVVALRRLKSTEVAGYLTDESADVALEAARAIYDTPIPGAMRALSEQMDQPIVTAEFQRRVLNANYRVGSREAAERIAEYAGRSNADTEMRIEALTLLELWNPQDPRDRVLNDYRPLEARQKKIAVEALVPYLPALMISENQVRDEAIRVASQLGIQGIAPILLERVADLSLGAFERASALSALSRLDASAAVRFASTVRLWPADELLLASLRVLAAHKPNESVETLIEATESRDLRVRQIAWDLLAPIDNAAVQQAIDRNLEKYLKGDLPKDVSLNVIEAAKDRMSSQQQYQVNAYQQQLNEEDPLGPWLLALEGGEIDEGRRIFLEDSRLSCLRCHQVGRAGGQVGPNLTTIGGSKNRRYLLESICRPDAVVAPGFETAVILNVDGSTVAGIVKSENEDQINLVKPDGSLVQLNVEDIEARKRGKSSMPEDLIKKLDLRQLRDLVAYLASLQQDPRSLDEIE